MPPRTIVLQSYRTHDVPSWVGSCMETVRDWARDQGFDYEFMDDRFFDLAPAWVRRKCEPNLYAVTDICRLAWMKERIDSGYGRAIWMDADVLVFAPEHLRLDLVKGYGFAHELLIRRNASGKLHPLRSANNAVMCFDQGNPVLDFYLYAGLRKLESMEDGQVLRCAMGPDLIRGLGQLMPLSLIQGVGLFALDLARELATNPGPCAAFHCRQEPVPLGAANLCHFLRNTVLEKDRPIFDEMYQRVVDRLRESRGGILHGHPASGVEADLRVLRVSVSGHPG